MQEGQEKTPISRKTVRHRLYEKQHRGSCSREAVRGIPQGLSLGLLFFNIFLSDLGTKVRNVIMKLAKDTMRGDPPQCTESLKVLLGDLENGSNRNMKRNSTKW